MMLQFCFFAQEDDDSSEESQPNDVTNETTSDEEDWIDEDHDNETTDNFIEGVNT